MAKPAKVKKDQGASAPAKRNGKAAPKGKVKEAGAKGKVKEAPARGKGKEAAAKGKGRKEEAKGLKGRLSRAQAAKPAKGKGAKEKKGAVQFLREVRVELSKVTWPTREELIQSTIVVLIAVAISGVFIAILDAIFSRLVSLIS